MAATNESEPTYPAAMQMFTLLRLLERRSTRALSFNDLAERLQVNRRTIVRYVKVLAACVDTDDGRPVLRRELRDGEAWAVLNDGGGPLSKGIFHFAATYAASRHLAGKPVLDDSVTDVLDDLRGGVRPAEAARILSAFHYVPFGPKDYRCREEVLEALVQAVVRGRRVEIRYRARGARRAEQRLLEPWTLVMYRDGLYVWSRVLRSGDRADMRLYAVERIEEATLDRASAFTVPDDYDPERTFGRTIGLWQSTGPVEPVELAFSPVAVDLARERAWPGFQAWRVEPSGREVLVLNVPVTPEVVSWVLTWGPTVEVLAPASLRDQVTTQLTAALAQYASPDGALDNFCPANVPA